MGKDAILTFCLLFGSDTASGGPDPNNQMPVGDVARLSMLSHVLDTPTEAYWRTHAAFSFDPVFPGVPHFEYRNDLKWTEQTNTQIGTHIKISNEEDENLSDINVVNSGSRPRQEAEFPYRLETQSLLQIGGSMTPEGRLVGWNQREIPMNERPSVEIFPPALANFVGCLGLVLMLLCAGFSRDLGFRLVELSRTISRDFKTIWLRFWRIAPASSADFADD